MDFGHAFFKIAPEPISDYNCRIVKKKFYDIIKFSQPTDEQRIVQ